MPWESQGRLGLAGMAVGGRGAEGAAGAAEPLEKLQSRCAAATAHVVAEDLPPGLGPLLFPAWGARAINLNGMGKSWRKVGFFFLSGNPPPLFLVSPGKSGHLAILSAMSILEII